MQKITHCLWFDNQAEEAAKFYTSVCKNSKIEAITRYGKEASQAAHRPEGSVMTVTFELEGQKFMGLNGGPIFKFTEAVSFMVNCKDQEELDEFWNKLSEGGQESQCGWLKDKYGLSWQIVPEAMYKMMQDKDAQKLNRVMAALMPMKKIDIAVLEKAYNG